MSKKVKTSEVEKEVHLFTEEIDTPLIKDTQEDIEETTKKPVKIKKQKKKLSKESFTKDKMRKFLMGTKDDMGFLKKLFVYVILTSVGFIFVFPLIKMLSTSMMSLADLLDSSIKWIPSKFNTANFENAANAMKYWKSLKDSILISGVPTLIQVCVCAFVGYGLARYNFKGKGFMMAVLVFSFIIPAQLLILPTYVLYNNLGFIGSMNAFTIPALVGQGFKSQLFIFICWSFFKQIPHSLIEASQIDGAGHIKTFLRVAIPSATGALVVVFLFSFVWYWNEQYLSSLYLYTKSGESNYTPLINGLTKFDDSYNAMVASQGTSGTSNMAPTLNTSVKMAGTIITILPLLVIYAFLQKQFVESVDRAGITGE